MKIVRNLAFTLVSSSLAYILYHFSDKGYMYNKLSNLFSLWSDNANKQLTNLDDLFPEENTSHPGGLQSLDSLFPEENTAYRFDSKENLTKLETLAKLLQLHTKTLEVIEKGYLYAGLDSFINSSLENINNVKTYYNDHTSGRELIKLSGLEKAIVSKESPLLKEEAKPALFCNLKFDTENQKKHILTEYIKVYVTSQYIEIAQLIDGYTQAEKLFNIALGQADTTYSSENIAVCIFEDNSNLATLCDERNSAKAKLLDKNVAFTKHGKIDYKSLEIAHDGSTYPTGAGIIIKNHAATEKANFEKNYNIYQEELITLCASDQIGGIKKIKRDLAIESKRGCNDKISKLDLGNLSKSATCTNSDRPQVKDLSLLRKLITDYFKQYINETPYQIDEEVFKQLKNYCIDNNHPDELICKVELPALLGGLYELKNQFGELSTDLF